MRLAEPPEPFDWLRSARRAVLATPKDENRLVDAGDCLESLGPVSRHTQGAGPHPHAA
jgi:hypothetical protein